MKRVRRFDISKITGIEKTPQGFLRVPGYVTRTGVFIYRKQDGSVVRELRPPDEVFSKDSIESLKLIPVTNNHPSQLVTAENAKQFSIGFTGESVDKEDKFLKTTLTVTDANGIADIENGKVELSCGYESEIDETPGVFQGEEYDCVQRNIKYNHVAIVDKGRAGRDVRLKLDADDAILDESSPIEGETMEKITIGGKEFECSPELAAAIKSEMDKMGGMEKEMTDAKSAVAANEAKAGEMQGQMEQVQKDKDALQAKCDELESELKKRTDSVDEKAIQTLVQKRIGLEKSAGKILGSETKLDGMSDLDVMKAVIEKKHAKFNFDGKSNEYIQARFDAIAEMVEGSEKTVEDFSKNKQNRNDGETLDAQAARQKWIEESHSAWKKPSAVTKGE